MAANKLTTEQKELVLERLAAHHTYQEIADHLGVTKQAVHYYADQNAEKIKLAQEAYDKAVIDRGLRSAQRRIDKLERLANRIEASIEDRVEAVENGKVKGLWVKDVKLAGTQKVEIEVFAGDAVRQYRGLLDDIAKEMGHRVNKQEVTGRDGGPVELDVSDVSNLTPRERLDRLNSLLQSARDKGSLRPSED